MEKFNHETQSHLLENLSEPTKFIDTYNKIVTELNELELEYKYKFTNIDISKFVDIFKIDGRVVILPNGEYKNYQMPESALLQIRLMVLLSNHNSN